MAGRGDVDPVPPAAAPVKKVVSIALPIARPQAVGSVKPKTVVPVPVPAVVEEEEEEEEDLVYEDDFYDGGHGGGGMDEEDEYM